LFKFQKLDNNIKLELELGPGSELEVGSFIFVRLHISIGSHGNIKGVHPRGKCPISDVVYTEERL